jgi:hypothetical protein
VADDSIDTGQLGRLDYLAEGGQGKVYDLPDLRLDDVDGAVVYKQYKPGQVSPAGLEAIVRLRINLAAADRDRLDALASWPCRLVKEQGQTIGILMPRIGDAFVHEGLSPRSGVHLKMPREVQLLFVAPDRCKRLGYPLVNLFQRYAICRELAGALAFLARHKVVFGDVNAKNALFSLGPGRDQGGIMLVDCDAVRVSGSASAVQQLSAPDWEPPAAEAKFLTHETDVYKFGLFVVRTLSPARNASTARDPRRVDQLLDPEGRMLLQATLGPKGGRPRAADWHHYLANLTNEVTSTPSAATTALPRTAPRPSAPPTTTAALPARPSKAPTVGWVRGPGGSWVRPD